MQGMIKTTGVAVSVPITELNLSKEFPSSIQSTIATAMIIVLCTLISQYLTLDSFILLKMYPSTIVFAGKAESDVDIITLIEKTA